MKKYNLSRIMKRAWELVKRFKETISSALKKAWRETKMKITKLKGSEKQIAWAKELIEKMSTEFTSYLNMVPKEQKEKAEEILNKIVEITKESYAGDVIELLSKNNKASDEYYRSFYTQMRISGNALCMRLKKEVFGR